MGWWEGFVDMGCCCDSSVLSGGWSGGVGEGRRVSSGRVKSGGPSAVQTKIGAMVTKDTTGSKDGLTKIGSLRGKILREQCVAAYPTRKVLLVVN